MKQDAVRLASPCREAVARQPKIDRTGGHIAEREACQHAIARDRMKVARHRMPYVVKPGRRRLADAVGVVAVPAAECHSRHQRGTDEPLAIDDIVVAVFAYGASEARHLPPRRETKRLFPPSPGAHPHNPPRPPPGPRPP